MQAVVAAAAQKRAGRTPKRVDRINKRVGCFEIAPQLEECIAMQPMMNRPGLGAGEFGNRFAAKTQPSFEMVLDSVPILLNITKPSP